MIIPENIKIQIVDKQGEIKALGNLIFGLKIYINDFSYHNYNPVVTQDDGSALITRQDIVENTELKWNNYDFDSNEPTKFELLTWPGEYATQMIQHVENLLRAYKNQDFMLQSFRKVGIAESEIPNEVANLKLIIANDEAYYNRIKNAVNAQYKIITPSIMDTWFDDLPKSYNILVD